ncbi:hypothetical protein [Nocardioides sp.]|uniref:hypothetical protein n=1 Tax=Nocardioides sp. TaxID=35761 RepID=UPI0027349717|nr:hypothetical protein [Nocardioides sp.]MDP3889714.1 hypothetical protein [Nocardioides sp.]
MFARSTTIMGDPTTLDSGIAYVRDEVMPALMAMDGAVGLSLLCDRESGQCIATSSWATEDAMRASDLNLRPMRERAGELMQGTPQVEEWDALVMHRDHHSGPGACCRATWMRFDHGTMESGLDLYRYVILPALEELDGFCSASLLVNRELGRACSTTTFDSVEAMEASRERSWAIREQGVRESGVDVLDVAEYELAVAHLHLPELV